MNIERKPYSIAKCSKAEARQLFFIKQDSVNTTTRLRESLLFVIPSEARNLEEVAGCLKDFSLRSK
jgi:hypothetical protein